MPKNKFTPIGMMVDHNEVNHGALDCGFNFVHKFKCEHCGRWICYCAGHSGWRWQCIVYCDDCCPCAELDKQDAEYYDQARNDG